METHYTYNAAVSFLSVGASDISSEAALHWGVYVSSLCGDLKISSQEYWQT